MIDWDRLAVDLDAEGSALIPGLLAREACESLAALYPLDPLFRSRVLMERHGFGRGPVDRGDAIDGRLRLEVGERAHAPASRPSRTRLRSTPQA